MERKQYIPNMRFVGVSDISELGGTCLTAAFAKAANDLHELPLYSGDGVYKIMNPSGKERSNYMRLTKAIKSINKGRLDTRTKISYKDIQKSPMQTVKGEIEAGNMVIFGVDSNYWRKTITSHTLGKKGVGDRVRSLLSNHVALASGLEESNNGELRVIVDDSNFRNSMSISADCFNECVLGNFVVVVSKIE